MAELQTDQGLMWAVFQNLRNDASPLTPDENVNPAYAQDLLNGFLNNSTFQESIIATATEMQRSDIVTEVSGADNLPTTMQSIVTQMVSDITTGNTNMLVDLIESPEVSVLSLEKLGVFWNAAALISEQDPELYTHIQADPRYVQNFDAYVSANEITGDSITALRAEVVENYEAASKTLDTMEFDGIQMQLYATAGILYDLSAKGDYATLGFEETAENTIFTGLSVAEPLSLAELTSVTAEMPHIAIQQEKNGAVDLTIQQQGVIDTTFDNLPAPPTALASALEARAAEQAVDLQQNFVVASIPAEPVIIDPSALSRDQIIAGLNDLQANDATVTLGTYRQGFELLNPDYAEFFDAVEKSGGILVNPLQDQLETALNESPEVLSSMIDLSTNSVKLNALTASIETEAGSTDLVLALAKANDMAPLSTNPHVATPLEGPKIPDIEVSIATLSQPVSQQNFVTASTTITPETELDIDETYTTPLKDVIEPAPVADIQQNFVTAALNNPAAADNDTTANVRANADVDVVNADAEATPDPATYEVQSGDNLWNIAKNQYGLESYQDIMKAVDHIAHANGLERGTDANWINPGQEINMPSADDISKPADGLDWKALAEDPKLGTQTHTHAATMG